jgi:folate-binding protein YgfZ
MTDSVAVGRSFARPAIYSSVEQEFDAATARVALVDRSATGRLEATGADARDLLHRLSTNDLLTGKPGRVVGTVFTTEKGRIIDYVHVIIKDTSLLLLTSPSNEQTFSRWIEKFTIMEEISLKQVTGATVMFSLLGPNAPVLAGMLAGTDIPENCFLECKLSCGDALFVHRREFHTASVDVLAEKETADELWGLLNSAGTGLGLERMGTRAYQAFRISRGIPELGAELSDAYNPYEAGVVHAVSFTKGCYIGQEVIARLDTYQKVQHEVRGIEYETSEHLNKDALIIAGNREDAGVITSVCHETIHGRQFAIGILKKGLVRADDTVTIVSGKTQMQGRIREFPL